MEETFDRILAVDDQETNLVILKEILCPEHQIFTATNGEDCLIHAVSDKPDLILLDIAMPGIDGFDTLKKLKSTPETWHIPVIIITGMDTGKDEERGFNLGAVDYIVKPFRYSTVRSRVKTHLNIVKQMKTVERLGLIDPLTSISNRRRFDERFCLEWKRTLRERLPLSLMMIDVDKFKTYNDTYGHPQGDSLLKAIAKTLESFAKRPADLAARVGGEEFILLLPETPLEPACKMAESIRSAVEALRVLTADGQKETNATLSIGLASIIPTVDDRPEDFISRSDALLYKAKEEGRNRVCCGKN